MTIKRIQGMPDKRLDEVIKSVLKTYLRESERKDLQLSLILNSNPPDDKNMPGHAWIRSTGDIHKWEETLENFGYGDLTPDFRKKDVEKALRQGGMVVYSSKPITNGTFVTPSRMEGRNYAGGGKVYAKYVDLDDVAWLDALQGQYAKVENLNESEGKNWLTIWTDIKDYVGAKSNGVNSAYKSGELPDGSTYTIRVATHPANPFNLDTHNEDTDYILSIVVTDDFSRNDQRYEPMTDEWNGRWQVVILSDDYDEQSVKRGIDRFLQCGDGSMVGDNLY